MDRTKLIELIKEHKISFTDLVYHFYQEDAKAGKKPVWLKPDQQKWIRDAFSLLNEAQL